MSFLVCQEPEPTDNDTLTSTLRGKRRKLKRKQRELLRMLKALQRRQKKTEKQQ